MFVVGAGRVHADEVVEGDRIRNADLHELTVLSIEADARPQIVHNLEIADAHTHFAGELEAWGHNARSRTSGNSSAAQKGKEKHCQLPELLGDDWDYEVNLGKGVGRADAVNFSKGIVFELKSPTRRSRDKAQVDRYLCALRKAYPGKKWTGIIGRYN
ncbi:MAG: hypothetical protein ABJ251_10940 [Paracoccaceae bacterium]